jgi:hypothetical protein
MSDLLPHTTGGGGGYVPARSADPLTGSVLDKYEVLHKLGEGGMATVYRGRHTTLGRDVAIKVLPAQFARDVERSKRFEREAKALASQIRCWWRTAWTTPSARPPTCPR